MARYIYTALRQREGIDVAWLPTYPRSKVARFTYRANRNRWRTNLRRSINGARRDIALFVNLPPEPERLIFHSGNVLWLTDAPCYGVEQLAAFSRIYVSDPGYAAEVTEVAGQKKFAGVLPFACQPSIHFPQPGNVDTDICFIGNRDPHRDIYLQQILNADCSCHIIGNYFLQHRLFWQNLKAFRPSVANNSLAKVYSRYRLSLNVHAQVVRHGTNMRTYECASCGIAQLVEYKPGIETLFIPDEEICLFRTADDLAEVLPRLLADGNLRRTMRRRARERVLSEHTYAHRLDTLLKEF